MGTIYLDNNATTKIAPEVVEVMQPFFGESYGNPSSIHRFGGILKKSIDYAREQVAAFLNAYPDEIFFTSCGTESDNLVIQGFNSLNKRETKIITSTVEHPAVQNCCKYLSKNGVSVSEIPVDSEGLLVMERLKNNTLDKNTLVTLMWANNETGVLFPIDEITEIVKKQGGFIHTDAVQAVGKIPIDLKAIPLDFLSLSGHKLHAPKGIGVLFIRRGTKLPPIFYGGHQEKGFRPGTENVAFIVGIGKACELASKNMNKEQTRVKSLRDRLEEKILSTCTGAHLNGNKEKRLPNTTNISFEFIEGESILLLLDENNIAASSGSACTTGSLEPSHVMRAMGIPYTLAHSSIRFSLSVYSTDQEIDTVCNVLPGIIENLRSLSPYVK